MLHIHLIVAARPNFVKAAPLCRALTGRESVRLSLIHTGQHYDPLMSDRFFDDFALPAPAHHLGVGSGTHGEQTAGVMLAYERVFEAERPDWTLVVGDVNATLAAALTVKKCGGRVGHVEAGLRAFDMTMPEEINRKGVDAIADRLWAPSQDAVENLRAEGRRAEDIHLAGNVMIDALEMLRPRIEASGALEALGVKARGYVLASLHRPHNVDTPEALAASLAALDAAAETAPVIFPVHPRTRARMESFELAPRHGDVRVIDPLDYVAFLALQRGALAVITDSGGVQEETTHEGVPCLTLRPNTERPITVSQGTNRLLAPGEVGEAVRAIASGPAPAPCRLPFWDGKAAERIADDLEALYPLSTELPIKT